MGAHKVVPLLCVTLFTLCVATPPPGHVKKPDNDKAPPKYEYGYDVRDGKGGRQGHLETRDGEYALGMYYVNLPDGSGQSVRYFADDWGYHPLVSYTSSTHSGSTKTQFALGEKAVKALSKTNDNQLISAAGPTASVVTSSVLKQAANRQRGNDRGTQGDVLKIRPGKLGSSSDIFGASGSKSSSYQQVSHSSGRQKPRGPTEDSNHIIVHNIDVQYQGVTPSTSQTILLPSTPTPSDTSYSTGDSTSYEGLGYQQVGNNLATSSSYQLVELGSGTSIGGARTSGSFSDVSLPLASQPTKNDEERITFYKSSGLKFGDRIPKVRLPSSQTLANVHQQQNEIYKQVQEIHKVSATPAPQRLSSSRPIVVADLYSKDENKQVTGSLRPLVIYQSTTPSPIHTPYVPQSTPSLSYSSSQINSQSGSSFNGEYTNPKILPSSQSSQGSVSSYSYESGSLPSSSYGSGETVTNVPPVIYTTPTPLSLYYSNGVSYSSSDRGRHTSQQAVTNNNGKYGRIPAQVFVLFSNTPVLPYSDSSGGRVNTATEINNANTVTALYSNTPKLSYSDSSAVGVNAVTESNIANTVTAPQSNTKLLPYSHSSGVGLSAVTVTNTENPVTSIYSNTPHLPYYIPSGVGVNTVTEKNVGNTVVSPHPNTYIYPYYDSSGLGVNTVTESNTASTVAVQYTTPVPILLGQSQVSTSSLESGQKSQHQAVTSVNNVNAVHILDGQNSSPSFSASNSGVVGSQSSNSVIITNDGNSGQISNSAVQATTLQPIVSSTPATIIVKPNPLPVPAGLAYSSEVLAPIQAGISLGASSHQQAALSEEFSTLPVTSQPPPVTEEVDDIPQTKTIVEIQKAISLDFNSLTTKQNEDTQKYIEVSTTPLTPISYKKQLVDNVNQIVQKGSQNINAGNNIQQAYSQPVIGLQVPPQIVRPHTIASGQNLGEFIQNQVGGKLQTLREQGQPIIQVGGTEGKLNYDQELTAETKTNLGYHNKNVETLYQSPIGSSLELTYLQPLLVSQQISYQVPPNQILFQPLGDVGNQVQYQAFVEPSKQLSNDYHLNTQVVQNENHLSGQSGYNHNIIYTPGSNNQNTQSSGVATAEQQLAQSINKEQSAYNVRPDQVVQQQPKEYDKQRIEEEKQEVVKFSKQISNALRQLHAQENFDLGKQIPLQLISEQRSIASILPAPQSLKVGHSQIVTTVDQSANAIPVENKQHSSEVVEVEKPVVVEHTKLATAEKPVPVPQQVPVEVTSIVPVETPVPYPQLYAIPQPVPIPVAVPQPIGVPLPHLVPYPQVVPLPYKEIRPVYINSGNINRPESAKYRHHVQHFSKNVSLPDILKTLQYNGVRYGDQVTVKNHRFNSRLPQATYLTPPPLNSSGRGRGSNQSKYRDYIRTLCIEYGFKPPLVPSKQLDQIPLSAYGPPKKP